MNRPNLMTPRILWFALLMSQGMYLGILHVPGLVQPPSAPPDPMLLYVFGGSAFMAGVASFLVPFGIRKNIGRSTRVATVEAVGAARSASFRETHAAPRAFEDRDAALREGLRRGFAPFIISLALTESIALIGFTLGFLGHPLFVFLPFFIVAWLLMLARFPTEKTFLAPVAEANGVIL